MKILVATDGSNFSAAAVEFCRNLVAGKPSIKIISAVEHPTPMAAEPFAVSAEYYGQLDQLRRKQARGFVEDAEARIRSFYGGDGAADITTEVVGGAAQRAIVGRAKEWGADLIVVGSHGYGFWSRALLGSISNAVINHAPCSVLVVRTPED